MFSGDCVGVGVVVDEDHPYEGVVLEEVVGVGGGSNALLDQRPIGRLLEDLAEIRAGDEFLIPLLPVLTHLRTAS